MNDRKQGVLRQTDSEAVRLAHMLVRTAVSGALATLDPQHGRPIATRVGVSTDIDGTPVILVSELSAHTPALFADPRCSLLVGMTGKGDPLAHARITIAADARAIERGSPEQQRIEARYLAHQQKARLYAALPDFHYFRLEPQSAALNGGFGRAYALTREQVLSLHPQNDELAAVEASALAHMNEDHAEAVDHYAQHFAGAPAGPWKLVGIDAEGIDLALGDERLRVFFEVPLSSAHDMHMTLVRMAKTARAALAGPH